MIPKTIHYIWLGKGEKPKIFYQCLESWKKFCPDYEIKEWTEDNLDINICQYCKDAYSDKKYAFASDVLRFEILRQHGGVYLDIDVELLKKPDQFLENKFFTAFESESIVNPGLIMGAEKNDAFVEKIVNLYKTLDYRESRNREETVCTITSNQLKSMGFSMDNTFQKVDDIALYPTEYFCPLNFKNGKLKKTKNTHAIHHYASTWLTKKQKIALRAKQLLHRMIGEKNYTRLKKCIKKS